jgi:hypothetical protein
MQYFGRMVGISGMLLGAIALTGCYTPQNTYPAEAIPQAYGYGLPGYMYPYSYPTDIYYPSHSSLYVGGGGWGSGHRRWAREHEGRRHDRGHSDRSGGKNGGGGGVHGSGRQAGGTDGNPYNSWLGSHGSYR